MRRLIQIGFISIISLVGAVLVLVSLLLVGLDMNKHGIFPCKPLERWNTEVPIANGGLLELAAVEERGPIRGYGFRITASYRAPQTTTSEHFASWSGNATSDPKVYVAGSHLVVLSPDQESVHVRIRDGQWKTFSMAFPSEFELSSYPVSRYCEFIGISEDDLKKVRSSLDEESRRYDPSVSVTGFDPQTRILTLLYYAKMGYDISLRLSDDGTMLQIIDIHKATGAKLSSVRPGLDGRISDIVLDGSTQSHGMS